MSVPVTDIAPSSSSATNVTSLSWNHNFGALANATIIIGIYLNVSVTHNTTITLTVGGVSVPSGQITYLATDDGDLFFAYLAMGTVSAGNQSIAASWTNTAAISGGAESYSTTNQSSPLVNIVSLRSALVAGTSLSPTTTVNDMAVDTTGDWFLASNPNVTASGQNRDWSNSVGGGTFFGNGSHRAGLAGSTTLSWTDSGFSGSIGQIAGCLQGTVAVAAVTGNHLRPAIFKPMGKPR